MNSSFAGFSSSLGACHLAPASVSSSLLRNPFLRTFPKSKAPKSKTSKIQKSEPILIIRSEKSVTASTYTRSTSEDTLPPTYRVAVGAEDDLSVEREILDSYFEDDKLSADVVEQQMQAWDEERNAADRERVARQDLEMGRALASMGL